MICYLDSSALVKRYFNESGSAELRHFIAGADALGTAIITRAEVVAAFAKAVRLKAVAREAAEAARQIFQTDFRDFAGIEISESVVDRAADLAWNHGLRGYDSVQLAAAATWQESLDVPLTVATFDGQLWEAAARIGLNRYPQTPPRIR